MALQDRPGPLQLDAGPTASSRDRMVDLANLLIDAMVVYRDPGVLPLSPVLKTTENGRPMPLGEGLWRTAGAISFRQIFADGGAGQAGLYGVAHEPDGLAVLFMRIRAHGGLIAEIETVVARKGEASLFAPEAMLRPDPLFDAIVPAEQRTTRIAMIAAAQAYYDGIETGDGTKVPAAPGAYQVENGVDTSLQLAGHCNAGLHLFGWIKPVRDRRFPIVDLKRGLIWAIVAMDIAGAPYSVTVDGRQEQRQRQARSIIVAELFKIVAGRTRRMDVIMRDIPFGGAVGWPA